MAGPQTSLLGEPDSEAPADVGTSYKFWCVDCTKLLIWRGEGSDRRAWKALCSVCLIAELGFYMYVVREHLILISMAALTSLKMFVEIWGQDTPTWVCPGGPLMFFVVFALILPSIIYADGICTRNPDILFNYHEWVGLGLFLFGSAFSLSYEVGRFQWKTVEDNKGRLHTIGLAKYCIHPNYFGDLFTYTGWALAAGTTCALSAPVTMIWSFVIFVCPNSDAYLATRYWQEFPEYEQRTASLIPGIRNKLLNQLLGWTCFGIGAWLGAACAGQC